MPLRCTSQTFKHKFRSRGFMRALEATKKIWGVRILDTEKTLKKKNVIKNKVENYKKFILRKVRNFFLSPGISINERSQSHWDLRYGIQLGIDSYFKGTVLLTNDNSINKVLCRMLKTTFCEILGLIMTTYIRFTIRNLFYDRVPWIYSMIINWETEVYLCLTNEVRLRRRASLYYNLY